MEYNKLIIKYKRKHMQEKKNEMITFEGVIFTVFLWGKGIWFILHDSVAIGL